MKKLWQIICVNMKKLRQIICALLALLDDDVIREACRPEGDKGDYSI